MNARLTLRVLFKLSDCSGYGLLLAWAGCRLEVVTGANFEQPHLWLDINRLQARSKNARGFLSSLIARTMFFLMALADWRYQQPAGFLSSEAAVTAETSPDGCCIIS